MNRSVTLGVVLMVLFTVLQSVLFARFELFGVALQPAILVAIVWGLLRGPYEGLIWAFMAGILLDQFSITPTGISAIALMAAVLVVVQLKQILPENPYLLPVLLAGLAIAIHYIVYSVILWVAQFGINSTFLSTLPRIVVLHALLTIPVYWIFHYVDRLFYPRRIEV